MTTRNLFEYETPTTNARAWVNGFPEPLQIVAVRPGPAISAGPQGPTLNGSILDVANPPPGFSENLWAWQCVFEVPLDDDEIDSPPTE